MTGVTTRQQKMAERAYQAIAERQQRSPDFDSFAKGFPALLHSAGLCQAVAFALAKKKHDVLADVIRTMGVPGVHDGKQLNALCRSANVMDYLRLSRLAIQAATWVKRYVEAFDASLTPSVEE